MKKILFASTALVATAGVAAAEISFSGEAGFGFIYNDAAADEWTPDFYTTLNIDFTGETDGGLSFGADLDLTFDNGASGVTDNQVVWIEGGFGKFSVGTVGSAVDAKLGLSDIGYSGLGTDNTAELLVDAGDLGNMMYEGTFGDFAVALSYDMSGSESFSIAATYTMGDYDFGLGYDDIGTHPDRLLAFLDNTSAFHVKAGANFGDFEVDALYSRNDDADIEGYGITAGYTMGAVSVLAAYSEASGSGGSTDAYGLGVSYDLGGGASIKAGVGEINDVTEADLGIVMTF